MGVFGRKPKETPEELAQRWTRELRSQMRGLDRQVMGIEREERKIEASVRAAAQKNDQASAKILAKELIRSRHAKERLLTTKATLNSSVMAIRNQMAQIRVAGTLSDSTPILTAMNDLVKVPELRETVKTMSKEFAKAGMCEEMIGDAMDDAIGIDGEDEAADEAVDQIFEELAIGGFDKVGTVGTARAGQRQSAADAERQRKEAEEMQRRLATLE